LKRFIRNIAKSFEECPEGRVPYGTLNVNYALFSAFITGYIVFLLSLADVPGHVIAQRRALCTALGGSIALIVILVVISRRMSLWKGRSDCPSEGLTF
jgi:hypothetical protein